MKKIAILAIAIGLLISSCLPSPVTGTPAPSVDLNATAAILVEQTIQALPSITLAPSNTAVVVTQTLTVIPTNTATTQSLITGTITSTGTLTTLTSTAATQTTNTNTPTVTLNPSNPTATETLHPRFYGTLPPDVAYNSIELANKSNAEAYISLQVTVADGSTTILEYPVAKLTSVQIPVGRYKYVVWVGGRKIVGSFGLDADHDLRITIYKDRVEVKSR